MSFEPVGQNPEHGKREFWIACQLTQVYELALADREGDIEHFMEELVDTVLVGLDGIRLLGGDIMITLQKRIVENSTKNVSARDTQFYINKILRLQAELSKYDH